MVSLRAVPTFERIEVRKNETRTSKVGAISKAQIFLQKKSHSAEKWTLLDLLTYISLQNIKKTRRGDPSGTLKNFRKKIAQCRKEIHRGDPLGASGFVGFLEKVKNERGTLWTEFVLAGLGALGGFRIVSKKWTDQCEDCSLKQKKGHCYSRAFFLKRIKCRLKNSHYYSRAFFP